MKSAAFKVGLLTALFLCSITTWSQVKKISGKITDEESKPLVGASVIVKGKSIGTQTNSSGEY